MSTKNTIFLTQEVEQLIFLQFLSPFKKIKNSQIKYRSRYIEYLSSIIRKLNSLANSFNWLATSCVKSLTRSECVFKIQICGPTVRANVNRCAEVVKSAATHKMVFFSSMILKRCWLIRQVATFARSENVISRRLTTTGEKYNVIKKNIKIKF